MAITRQDFKQIPSDGIIPDDRVPASAFAVGYTFTYFGYPSLSTFNHTFEGKIVLHVLDSSDAIKYVIEIEQRYNLFIFPMAPGLVLYTWNWVPSAEKISGRKGTGEDAEPMTTLGLATFGVEPAEDSGTSNGEVIVSSTFYSGVFTEPLARGDRIKIAFHNLSPGYVVSRAGLVVATEPGGQVLLRSLFHAPTGQTFLLHVDDGALKLARTRRMQPVMALREDEGTLADKLCDYESTLFETAPEYAGLQRLNGALYCLVQGGGRLRLLRSTDEGQNWNEVLDEMDELNMTVLASTLDET